LSKNEGFSSYTGSKLLLKLGVRLIH